MPLQLLVLLVFVTVTAGIVGIAMLVVGRSQSRRGKTIENRLSEVGSTTAAGTESALLAEPEVSSNVDRAARRPR